ncbi:efflux RND transporter periplasmic adaptor subunit [Paracoccus suum]|uniref:Efflux RND transporter periplasmic adaptor subunit n=1 Tax=Paracoccus suum TaxID=2259340 RepID=A0A344PG21_9RHOB|nr:efflux RND transporter periplasmic adaptor subunit [Paracoccus suum]AXC48326.1 efflux RND transporter periplasmic adaptor subunit [Paracoccus suum]
MTLPRLRFVPRLLLAGAAALALIVPAAPVALGQPAPGQGGPRQGSAAPKQVGFVTAGVSDVPQIVTLPGRAVAYEIATVRPRVGGLVEAITYEPGRPIEAGAPMFRLETETLDAALESARAAEQGATLARDNAQATVTRYRTLENKGVSRVDLQAAEVALSQAEASLIQSRTERQTAELERERAVITAPIAGITSETAVTIGSLVTANQADALATVTRVDPVYVDVAASSSQVLQSRQKIRQGVMTPITPPKLELTLEDGTVYDGTGEVVSTGSTVSPTTGTVDLRLKFANPDRMILPGQFLRVAITLGTIRAVLVPQRATTRLPDGSLAVFVVTEGGRAHRVMLTEQGAWNNSWAVTDGVAAGDRVIVDGLANLRDGQVVEAAEVELDENGVVVASEGGQRPAERVRPAPRKPRPQARHRSRPAGRLAPTRHRPPLRPVPAQALPRPRPNPRNNPPPPPRGRAGAVGWRGRARPSGSRPRPLPRPARRVRPCRISSSFDPSLPGFWRSSPS